MNNRQKSILKQFNQLIYAAKANICDASFAAGLLARENPEAQYLFDKIHAFSGNLEAIEGFVKAELEAHEKALKQREDEIKRLRG